MIRWNRIALLIICFALACALPVSPGEEKPAEKKEPAVRATRKGISADGVRRNPVPLIWVGNNDGKGPDWSVATNWTPAKVPGLNDTVIFDASVGANTNSTMNLGGGFNYHIAALTIRNGYNQTLTLESNLVVDVFAMRSAATVTSESKDLIITQRAGGAFPTTNFGTSFWTAGIIEVPTLQLWGEEAHQMTFRVKSAGRVNLKSDMKILAESTVQWVGGDIDVAKGKVVTNAGTFTANSLGGTMGNAGGAADMWTFTNKPGALLIMAKGKFSNETLNAEGGSTQLKVAP